MKGYLDQLLFKAEDPRAYAIVRITIGFACIIYFLLYTPHLEDYFSDSGFYPLETQRRIQLSVAPISLLYISGESSWVFFILGLSLLTSIAFTLGIYTRWTGPLLWLCVTSFINRNPIVFDGSFLLVQQLLLPVMFADTGAALSWDAWRRRKRGEEPVVVWSWLGLCLRFQLCVVYFYSGFFKLMGADWVQGESIRLVLAHPHIRRFNMDWFLGQEWFVLSLKVITVATAWWELLFFLLIFYWRTRVLALGFGLFLHGSQWFTISTGLFSPLLFSLYPLFLLSKKERTWFDKLCKKLQL